MAALLFPGVCSRGLIDVRRQAACAVGAVRLRPHARRARLGIADSDIAKFVGIPYAAPPVGGARWRAPAAAPERADILAASTFGPSCPQAPVQAFENPIGNAEDCLTLNVFTPARMDERLPVMVWIHGGGLISGTGADPLYDGSALARDG